MSAPSVKVGLLRSRNLFVGSIERSSTNTLDQTLVSECRGMLCSSDGR